MGSRSIDEVREYVISDIVRGRSVDWLLTKLSSYVTYLRSDAYLDDAGVVRELSAVLEDPRVTDFVYRVVCLGSAVDAVERAIAESPRYASLRPYIDAVLPAIARVCGATYRGTEALEGWKRSAELASLPTSVLSLMDRVVDAVKRGDTAELASLFRAVRCIDVDIVKAHAEIDAVWSSIRSVFWENCGANHGIYGSRYWIAERVARRVETLVRMTLTTYTQQSPLEMLRTLSRYLDLLSQLSDLVNDRELTKLASMIALSRLSDVLKRFGLDWRSVFEYYVSALSLDELIDEVVARRCGYLVKEVDEFLSKHGSSDPVTTVRELVEYLLSRGYPGGDIADVLMYSRVRKLLASTPCKDLGSLIKPSHVGHLVARAVSELCRGPERDSVFGLLGRDYAIELIAMRWARECMQHLKTVPASRDAIVAAVATFYIKGLDQIPVEMRDSDAVREYTKRFLDGIEPEISRYRCVSRNEIERELLGLASRRYRYLGPEVTKPVDHRARGHEIRVEARRSSLRRAVWWGIAAAIIATAVILLILLL